MRHDRAPLGGSAGSGVLESAGSGSALTLADLPNQGDDLLAELAQLELVYQPVIDLGGQQILGWEALVRWQHPEFGTVSPADFMPAAEQSGDILAIGGWVLNRACEDFSQALDADSDQSRRWISVNISPRQLCEYDFTETVRASLLRSGVEPGSLVLEIAEAAFETDIARVSATVSALRHDGVRFAIDDFRTTPESLHNLPQRPVDIVKIDRTFVTQDEASASQPHVAILSLCQDLGLDIVATRIEDADELERVKRFEQVAGQGYHLGRPMPLVRAREFELAAEQPN